MKYIGRNYRGDPAYLADIPATWWSLWLGCIARDHPDIKIVLIQAAGSAAASAGTHADGWAIDLQTWHLTREQRERLVAHMRRYGASGTWYRYPPAFEPHIHAALDPGGRETSSSYQVAAVRAGYDGLGSSGRRGRDIHPAPAEWITAEEGIRQMKARLSVDDNTPWEEPMNQDTKNELAKIRDGILTTHLPGCGTLKEAIIDTTVRVRKLAQDLADIRRGAPDPEYRPVNQEVADSVTLGRENRDRLTELEGKVDKLAAGVEALLRHAGVTAE